MLDIGRRGRRGPPAETGSTTASWDRILGKIAGPWWCRVGEVTGLVFPVIVDHGDDSLEYMDELDALRLLAERIYSSNGMPGGVVG